MSNLRAKADPKAREIAAAINSRKEYHAAQTKLERMESRSYATPGAQERADKTINVLREALMLSEDKAIRHQLIVEPSIFVPPEALKCAFEILDFDDPRRTKPELIEPGLTWWNDMDDYDEPEPRPRWLETLRDVVELINTPATISEKMAALDALLKRRPAIMDEILSRDDDLSAGQTWRVEVLDYVGCPKPGILVRQGVITLEDVLTVDVEKFGSRKGIGPKTVAALVDLQSAIRAGEVTEPFSAA